MTPEEIEEQKRQIAIAQQTLGILQAPMPENYQYVDPATNKPTTEQVPLAQPSTPEPSVPATQESSVPGANHVYAKPEEKLQKQFVPYVGRPSGGAVRPATNPYVDMYLNNGRQILDKMDGDIFGTPDTVETTPLTPEDQLRLEKIDKMIAANPSFKELGEAQKKKIQDSHNITTKGKPSYYKNLDELTMAQNQRDVALSENIANQYNENTKLQQDLQNQINKSSAKRQLEEKAFEDKLSKWKLDPKKYWNDKSTGEKILGALAIGLFQLGSSISGRGSAGPNQVMSMLDREVQNNIESQKAGHANEINVYNMMMKRHGSEELAEKQAYGFNLEQMDRSLKQLQLSDAPETQKLQGQMLQNELQKKIAENRMQIDNAKNNLILQKAQSLGGGLGGSLGSGGGRKGSGGGGSSVDPTKQKIPIAAAKAAGEGISNIMFLDQLNNVVKKVKEKGVNADINLDPSAFRKTLNSLDVFDGAAENEADLYGTDGVEIKRAIEMVIQNIRSDTAGVLSEQERENYINMYAGARTPDDILRINGIVQAAVSAKFQSILSSLDYNEKVTFYNNLPPAAQKTFGKYYDQAIQQEPQAPAPSNPVRE